MKERIGREHKGRWLKLFVNRNAVMLLKHIGKIEYPLDVMHSKFFENDLDDEWFEMNGDARGQNVLGNDAVDGYLDSEELDDTDWEQRTQWLNEEKKAIREPPH